MGPVEPDETLPAPVSRVVEWEGDARPETFAMSPEDWRTVKKLLEAALARDESQRARYLQETCASAPELRREVEALLALEEEADAFLETPAVDLHQPREPLLEEGRVVDRYRVVREIGAGGMGRVYLAERADEEFDREVALKVLKRGLDTDEIVSRFRRERQILANLQHASIAQMLDGGSTEEGLPYFVAEHVEGTPIDQYCEQHELSVDGRLELFAQVCDAVQYAHRSLVVHRDLKPGNILITEDGAPKLLDFGIAKLLGPDHGGVTLTHSGIEFRTPEAASPEQILGGPITTASDVYSLGALLYLLLTGHNPHTLDGSSRQEVEQAVCDRLPARPSRVAPEDRRRKLRGDLDNIVLTALRKEPDRRYGSVQELAEDIRRYLASLPVRASGDAWSYRFGKLVRRHTLAFGATAVVLLLILLFGVVSFVLLNRTERERQRAERVSDFLVELLTLPSPGESRGEDLTVREALDAGRERIFEGLEGEPELRAELLHTMARAYQSLGLYEDAASLFTEAVELRREHPGKEHSLLAESLHGLAGAKQALGDEQATAALLREALAIQRTEQNVDHPEYAKGLNNLAIHLEDRGDLEEAERLHREALALKRKQLAPEDPEIAVSLHNLAGVLSLQGDHAEAETLFRRALPIRRRHHGRISPEVARTLNSLATVVEARGNLDEAEGLYRESLAIRRELYPDRHPGLAVSLSNLGLLLQKREKLDEAETLFREALEILEQYLPQDHPNRGVVLRNLASLLLDRGQAAEAEPLAREALEIFRGSLEPGSWRIADAESVLGGCLAQLGRYEEATPLLLGAYPLLKESEGPAGSHTRRALERIIRLYTARGQDEQADRYRALRTR